MQELTTSRINAFYTELREAGVGARTVLYCHQTLRKALGDAVRWGEAPRNPAEHAEPPRNRAKAAMHVWSADQLRRFLEEVRDDRLHAAFMLAGTCGLRRAEVMGLRWRDVDLQRRSLTVVQALTAVRYKLVLTAPKTAKGRRQVDLDEVTVNALIAHRVRVLQERTLLGLAGPLDDALVFAQPDGKPTHPETLGKTFDRYVEKTGLPRIRLHDLRHTHASLMLEANVHPKIVSERLGHANISITLDTYSHLIPTMQAEAAQKVANLVFAEAEVTS
jgi:integrase